MIFLSIQLKQISMMKSEVKVNFSVDALGRLLDGDNGTIVDDEYYIQSGVILTLNSNFQKIVNEAAESMQKVLLLLWT